MPKQFQHTRIWLAWRRAQLTNLWPSALQAAQAMHVLNHHARRRNGHIIYPLKAKLVKHFYDRGYCQAVRLQEQVLKCTANFHFEDDGEEECPRCGGTGIYRTYLLFLFTFKIQSHTFEWHQPVTRVPWLKVGQAEIAGTYTNDSHGDIIESIDDQGKLVARVAMYLARHGVVGALPHPSFFKSLRFDLMNAPDSRWARFIARLNHLRIHLRSAITGKDPSHFDDYNPF
jgi:hypothetical protein